MSFELIMNFSKKMTRLVSLIASIEFNGLLGWKCISNEFMKEIWDVRRIFDPNNIDQAKFMSNLVMKDEQQFWAVSIYRQFQNLYVYLRLPFTTVTPSIFIPSDKPIYIIIN